MPSVDNVFALAADDHRPAYVATSGGISWRDWVILGTGYRQQLQRLASGLIGLRLCPTPEAFAALAQEFPRAEIGVYRLLCEIRPDGAM